MGKKKILSLILSMSVAFSATGTGCKSKKTEARVPGSDAYSCVFYDLPQKEGYEATFSRIFMAEENYCVSAIYVKYDQTTNESEEWTDIITVDAKGNTISTLEFPGNQLPSAVLPNEYAYIGVDTAQLASMDDPDPSLLENRAVFLDRKTGEVTKIVETGFHANFIVPVTDGFVIGGANDLGFYHADGSLKKTIHTDFHIMYDQSFFEDNGHYYVVEDKDESTYIYHEVDLQTGSCRQVTDTDAVGASIDGFCGKYFFRVNGEYKVDLTTMSVAKLADWNCVDIRPQKKTLRFESRYYPLDDNHFAKSYGYRDGTTELLLFTYDPSVHVENRKKITIGGYSVYDDLALAWVVYNFNTTNDEYRVVLEDYNFQFAGESAEGMRRGKLNLMKYFSEGNTPDLFYGHYFDYEYMGRIGMVLDMQSFSGRSGEWEASLTEPARNLMINEEGKCYQVFASYWMNGYEGLRRHFSSGADVDLFQLQTVHEETGIPIRDGRMDVASDAVYWVIGYNFTEVWGVYDGKKKITREQLEEALTIAYEAQDTAADRTEGYGDPLAEDICLMEGCIVSDYYQYALIEKEIKEETCFLGFPSIDGSVQLAMPNCCLAISTTTQYPDKCWELCRGLFSKDVQKMIAINGWIPVDQSVMDAICEAVKNPDEVKDEILKSYVYKKDPADEQVLGRFLEAVNSADKLSAYDWGLFTIVYDEVNSHYTQQRDIKQIAETLEKRLDLYAEENYQ